MILGDDGIITSRAPNTPRYGGLPITLGEIATTDDAVGGDDLINDRRRQRGRVRRRRQRPDHTLGSGARTSSSATTAASWVGAELNRSATPSDADTDRAHRPRVDDPTIGGNDTITTGTGNNDRRRGFGADTISGGSTSNVILGDSGRITAATADSPRFGGLPITLGRVETIDDATGGNDVITLGAGTTS